MLAQHQENATLIWVPTGLSLAALILWGRKVWPAIFLGALVVNFMVGTNWLVSLGISVGNTLEAVAGAWLLTSVVKFDPGFSRLRDVGLFLIFGVLVSPIVSATVGVGSLAAAAAIGIGAASTVWLDWWLGDAGGALVFAPLILIAFRGRPTWPDLVRRYETSAVFALTIVAAAVPFAGLVPSEWQLLGAFLPFPIIAWAGLRLGPRGAVIASSLTSVIAILGTAQGIGPFTGDAGLYLTWAYMTVMGMSALILAAAEAEREDVELAREQLDTQLQHSQRLDSVGMLAGGIAHDFNNLLTPILGYAEMIRTVDLPPDDRRRMLQDIESAAKNASDLCKLLLIYAGRRKPVMEPVDVAQLVLQTSDLLDSSKPGRIDIVTHISGDIPEVDGDPVQLRQIFLNLIVNAAEAIGDDGGTIAVRAYVETFDREYLKSTYLHSDAAPGKFVVIDVIDDGKGMSTETKERLFDAFFSTKSESRGLGMSVVQRIVRLHGGAIKVESEPGEGSVFRVLLRPRAADIVASRERSVMSPVEGGLILVADDDIHVRELTERMLIQAGYDVILAQDGADALAQFERRRDEIALVLLDVLMPGLDGKETFVAVRNINPSQRVIFMSGFDQARLDELENESFGFLQKPFSFQELTAAIALQIGSSSSAVAATSS